MKRLFYLLLAAVAITSCTNEPKVKNVIYLIGDGMGFGAVSSLLISKNEATGFELSPVIGLSETCSANNYVTDSPAGGTALACGKRTCNGYMGVDADGEQMESILKKAQKMGKKSGIVVNTVLTEATPGAFYAGVKSRSQSYDIAEQFTRSGVDVAIGAGLEPFAYRPDSLDLTKVLVDQGYNVYLDWQSVLNTDSQKFIGILPMDNVHRRNKVRMNPGAADGAEVCIAAQLAASSGVDLSDTLSLREPEEYLQKAVAKSLGVLEKISKKSGYFLMIESAIIDGYGHNNDSEGMIEEMREFDNTLKYLVNYVSEHPNTLLVVTADHETGGVAVSYKSHDVGAEPPVALSFSTKGHTGTVVPIFAYGAGAEHFSGIKKNYEIPGIIEELMK